MTQIESSYYSDKKAVLADLFGANQVEVEQSSVVVDGRRFPVVDDVIVLLEPDKYTPRVLRGVRNGPKIARTTDQFASDIQFTFGEEWTHYAEVLPEHEEEFRRYFDLVDVAGLGDATVCDLGCGSGRWSYFLRNACRQLVLVDFSDAIFAARENLSDCPGAVFFMADLAHLPFRNGFADLVVCLGVLHHLPMSALYFVRRLRRYAPRLLIYVYYALDNRPVHFRAALRVVTAVRQVTTRLRQPAARQALAWAVTLTVYVPIVAVGKAADRLRLGRLVPLHDTYRGKSLRRIRQDVYDRFFTRIEQRVTKASILKLTDTFATVTISPNLPYWHFICESGAADDSSRPAPHARSGPSDNPLQDAR